MPFIVFEGIDGVGKTTQAHLLERHLKDKGFSTLRVREPGGTPLGERIRDILLDPSLKIDGFVEALLYFASRRQLCEEIIKGALKMGFYVVAERFTLSTYAYQGFLRGVSLSFIEDLERELLDLPEKPFYVLLDLSPELALSRKRRDDRIEMESFDFFKRLRLAYLELARDRKNVKIVDASGREEEVFERILEVLRGEKLI
ncbi:MAG: dTMP kinase [Synergistetes bacterium]|nr:dTMP kinase [Synergistota bacterium]MDW8193106.1 dTMP kinase [Synergistota bacterium]